jgi:hypothetical protein
LRERLEQYNEEFGCASSGDPPPPLAPANSSSEEEEEEEGSDGGRAAPERWNPLPPSARAAYLVPVASAEALAAGSLAEAPAGATVAPPRALEEEEAGLLHRPYTLDFEGLVFIPLLLFAG